MFAKYVINFGGFSSYSLVSSFVQKRICYGKHASYIIIIMTLREINNLLQELFYINMW